MSPAYAPRNLLGVYPKVVEQVRNFRGVLERLATTESVFRMEEMAARFSFDAVGLFLLDREFNVQTDDKGPGRQAIKTLFIGGIDTSASALAWVYFFLSVYPDVLRRMREEHDAKIPGPREGALEQLAQNPSLLNELEYTAAVIKETLRLRPGGSVVRMVEKGMMIEDQGNEYAAWDHPIMINAHGIQRRPEYFHDPDAFDPDRWLTASPDPANAWRPFERGAHSCLGQEFATMNSKTALVATVRMFDFETKYSADALSWPDPAVGGKEVDGKAYQELTFSAKPKGGLPMVVSLRR
ncbi:hypothetical protein H2203_000430 [Taxawa tesnikishii (nom. ined.)]|nr:hypothetical protein H2203_000430 [Dothideales sp. JES 119]